jgi:hypothetical protein
MGDRHVSVTIDAPPEVVFGLYTDAGRNRRHHQDLFGSLAEAGATWWQECMP